MANVADGGAFAVTLAGFLTLPEPVISKTAAAATAVSWGALKFSSGLMRTYLEYVDPSDPDYGVVAAPRRTSGPHVVGGHKQVRRAANALSDNSVQLREVEFALFTALNRAQGAAQAGDDAARVRQLRAASRYGKETAALIAAGPALRRRLAAAFAAAHLSVAVSPRRVRLAQAKIARDGLPGQLVATAREFGAPDAWLEQYGSFLARARVRRTIDFRRLLRDRTLAARQLRAASAIRRQAQLLAP
jgi:hypothetical protein